VKTCTKCGQEKQSDLFYRQSRNPSGYSPWCKVCSTAYYSAYREVNRASLLEDKRAYHAANRDKEAGRKRERYRQDSSKKIEQAKRWYAANKPRALENVRRWSVSLAGRAAKRRYYSANRDSVQATIREWKARNPEALRDYFHARRARLKAAGGSHTRLQIAALLLRQNGGCAICKIDITVKRHRDHIVPLAAGGSNDITNIQLLCPPCNLGKRAKDMHTYLRERESA